MRVINPFNRCPMCNGKNLNIHGYIRDLRAERNDDGHEREECATTAHKKT